MREEDVIGGGVEGRGDMEVGDMGGKRGGRADMGGMAMRRV